MRKIESKSTIIFFITTLYIQNNEFPLIFIFHISWPWPIVIFWEKKKSKRGLEISFSLQAFETHFACPEASAKYFFWEKNNKRCPELGAFFSFFKYFFLSLAQGSVSPPMSLGKMGKILKGDLTQGLFCNFFFFFLFNFLPMNSVISWKKKEKRIRWKLIFLFKFFQPHFFSLAKWSVGLSTNCFWGKKKRVP